MNNGLILWLVHGFTLYNFNILNQIFKSIIKLNSKSNLCISLDYKEKKKKDK
jgi:hypothetical protein